jgi:transposase
MPNFKQMPMDPTQLMMFPSSVAESIPANADVRMLSEAMDGLDWKGLEASYAATGCPAYPPQVLCKILVYGLSKGVRSSRQLEDMAANHKCYIYLAGGLIPDHSTISRFRKDKQEWLKDAYKKTVRMCAEAGLVLLKVTATDGTKVLSKASKKSLYSERRVEKEMAAIEQILAEAEEVDRQEDEIYGSASGSEIPEELVDAKKRKEKLEEISKRLKESGRNNVSATDEECRVMKTGSGLRPAYNVQITADSAHGVIVAADVTNAENDTGQFQGQMEQVEENTGRRPETGLADTGYSDEGTYKYLAESGQDALIPPKEQPQEKKRDDLFASKCFLKDARSDVLICPAGRELTFRGIVNNHCGQYRVYRAGNCRDCSFYNECVSCKKKAARSVQISVVAQKRAEMMQRLRTDEGKRIYALRKQTVERDFANIKCNMGLDRFVLSGKEGAGSETWLACMTHNLMIYVRKAMATPSDSPYSAAKSIIAPVAAHIASSTLNLFVFTQNIRMRGSVQARLNTLAA